MSEIDFVKIDVYKIFFSNIFQCEFNVKIYIKYFIIDKKTDAWNLIINSI